MHRGIVIADIHSIIGQVSNYLLEMDKIIERISDHTNPIDFMIIAGDYFDRQMYLSDVRGYTSIRMLMSIIEICKKRKIKLRVVYGTESHEVNQYESLSLMEDGLYYRVIHEVEEENLFDDLKVLYLPEEILESFDKYNEYLSKVNEYDYVFGHGIIAEEMVLAALMSKSRKLPTNERIYYASELDSITKGYCIFGHYHTHSKIGEKVYYVGSYSRFRFGEEEDKGYIELEYDNDNYSMKFIKNELAPIYKTFTVDVSNNEELNDKLQLLQQEMDDTNHYKIKLGVSTDIDKNQMMYDMIHQYKNSYKDISFDIKLNMDDTNDIVNTDLETEFPILFDMHIDTESKTSYFIKSVYGNDIDIAFIKQVANKLLK